MPFEAGGHPSTEDPGAELLQRLPHQCRGNCGRGDERGREDSGILAGLAWQSGKEDLDCAFKALGVMFELSDAFKPGLLRVGRRRPGSTTCAKSFRRCAAPQSPKPVLAAKLGRCLKFAASQPVGLSGRGFLWHLTRRSTSGTFSLGLFESLLVGPMRHAPPRQGEFHFDLVATQGSSSPMGSVTQWLLGDVGLKPSNDNRILVAIDAFIPPDVEKELQAAGAAHVAGQAALLAVVAVKPQNEGPLRRVAAEFWCPSTRTQPGAAS